jgi:hypothetical protein
VIVTVPSLTMLSFGGLSSFTAPLRFDGFVQYFSNMVSLMYLARDRDNDSRSTPL